MALIAQGCATASKDVTTTYVSPLQYQSYDCEQITAETQRIQGRVAQLGGRLDEAANNDKGIMAVGLIIFWPALFALGGTKQQEAEYSRLKGEYDALEQQAILKKCRPAPPVQMTTATPSAPVATSVALPTPEPITPTVQPAVLQSATGIPAVVPVSSAAPKAQAAATTGIAGESKHMFAAERFAKANGCATPVATMTIKTATSETFTLMCAQGDPIIVRCDGACRALQ